MSVAYGSPVKQTDTNPPVGGNSPERTGIDGICAPLIAQRFLSLVAAGRR